MSDSDRETKPFKFVTGVDARFPNMNQTKHCWQNYVDYHKCILAKGEDFAPCRQFWLAYRSLCPSGWHARWDEQRGAKSILFTRHAPGRLDADNFTEAGNFPVRLE
ncbi:Cytochrome c oxidase subunit 6B [Cytospora mali]|uniref:Cytochrome c oxidase subunit 12, mitochondrial n=1 Tax=Cytospora mali TaxID=578113 RepID=A0A194V2B0_CYTMA|nr:Cytochrome c oxidase subunit 6B [Valsa mali var. pyri (nom. inval.)]